MIYWLAQVSEPVKEKAQFDAIFWLGVIMGVVIVGGVGILILRNKLRTYEDPNASSDTGFSLSDLRAMRDRGEITPEEFETTKAKIVAKLKENLDKPKGKAKSVDEGDGRRMTE